MVRHAAALLVIVMFAASGRLLACGWECIDEIAAAEASCHSTAEPSVAIEGGPGHECPPEAIEIPVTAAKKESAGSMAGAISTAARAVDRPIVPPAVASVVPWPTRTPASRTYAFSVLRI